MFKKTAVSRSLGISAKTRNPGFHPSKIIKNSCIIKQRGCQKSFSGSMPALHRSLSLSKGRALFRFFPGFYVSKIESAW